MKKLISYFLIFAISLATTPVQIFAQNLESGSLMYFRDKRGHRQSYKPAKSFEYEYYNVGEISPYAFVEKLEADLLNFEDYINPNNIEPVGRTEEGKPEHLRQSYNDFMYYNIYPEESPLWNYTGLIPSDGTQEVDVLRILDYHHYVAEEISELFAQNPKYKQERREKYIRLIPSIIVQILLFILIWEIELPELLATITTYTGWSLRLSNFITMIVLLPIDMFICDEAAFEMKNMDQRLNELFQSVGTYKNAAIRVSAETDLLKSVHETEHERIQQELNRIARNSWRPNGEGDIWLLKKYFKKGYSEIDSRDRGRLKVILGKLLYDVFDGDEVLINDYFRKEMLRTYYALEFIKDELKNTDDPLRYDRAIIDLATTYKIQNIQILDNRLITRHNQTEVQSFGQNLQQRTAASNLANNENIDFIPYIDRNIESRLGAELADQTSVMSTYPTMLSRAEVNYLVQLMDIQKKKIDFDEELAQRREIENRLQTYSEVNQRNEENRQKSNYRINVGEESINNMLRNVHGGDYFNLTGIR